MMSNPSKKVAFLRRGRMLGVPRLFWLGALSFVLSSVVQPRFARADRLRDVCDVVGVRDNQLVGYGVVTGLNGTGDDVSAPFAAQSLRALLRRLGVQADAKQMRLRNIAAVVVTTNIPAFARAGSHLDVTVSSVGNARSLRGGVLVQTPLRGADRRTYAVAQGALVIGGFSAGGAGASVQENVTNTARIPGGSLVEREIPTEFTSGGKVTLSLRRPDFTLAQRVVEAVEKEFGKGTATALDAGAVSVKIPSALSKVPVQLLAKLNELQVEPTSMAVVVINERTGTIVAGGDVHLLPAAISQGGITIAIKETKTVSQPNPMAAGQTTVTAQAVVEATEKAPPALTFVDGATSLAEVAQALSVFGVTPRELGSILQALKTAGALRAEVVVQ